MSQKLYRVFVDDMVRGQYGALSDVTAVSPKDAAKQAATNPKTHQMYPSLRGCKMIAVLHTQKHLWGDGFGGMPAALKRRAIPVNSLWKKRPVPHLRKQRAKR